MVEYEYRYASYVDAFLFPIRSKRALVQHTYPTYVVGKAC